MQVRGMLQDLMPDYTAAPASAAELASAAATHYPDEF